MRSSKNLFLWALIALNVVLLLNLIGRGAGSAAVAQVPPRLAAGTYLACPGEIVGGGGGGEVVYIFDTRNLILTAVQQTNRNLNVMAPINLQRNLDADPAP